MTYDMFNIWVMRYDSCSLFHILISPYQQSFHWKFLNFVNNNEFNVRVPKFSSVFIWIESFQNIVPELLLFIKTRRKFVLRETQLFQEQSWKYQSKSISFIFQPVDTRRLENSCTKVEDLFKNKRSYAKPGGHLSKRAFESCLDWKWTVLSY